jgi:AcrR family transcriptional regulator
MPKYADHEERRDELAETVREIILEHGIDRVSVRNVAERAGWSVGAIRYYFPRQEDLLVHALRRTITKAYGRVVSAQHPPPEDPLEHCVRIILAIAPVNDETRKDLRIWIAFLDRGMTQDKISELMHYIWESDRHYSRCMVASLAGIPLPEQRDEVLDDPFMEDTAAVLHVMWDGISFQGLMAGTSLTPEVVERLTRRVLVTISERIQNHLQDPLSTA